MGKLKMEKCVDPRAGWLWISGDGFPGSSYHIPGSGSKELREAARVPIACEVLAMAHASEYVGGLSSKLGATVGAQIGTAAISDCFSLFSQSSSARH